MTTEELKKELEELGLSLCDHGVNAPYYTVEDKNGIIFAQVDHTYEYIVEVCRVALSNQEKQQKLFNAVTKYAATPIEERNPKRRFQYRLKSIASYSRQDDDFLNYLKSKGYYVLGDSAQTNIWQTIFEENDPLLDGVSLEMFEAIEVDKEGNELHD